VLVSLAEVRMYESRKELQDVIDGVLSDAYETLEIKLDPQTAARLSRVLLRCSARMAQITGTSQQAFWMEAARTFQDELPKTPLEALGRGTIFSPILGYA
jgi:hypothetical protein